jgi:hypothetical protein
MKITSIHYEKVFPIAPYQNEKIGIEIQVDDGDDEDLVFAKAKTTVDIWGYKQVMSNIPNNSDQNVHDSEHIDPPHEKDSFTTKLSLQIANCKSLEELAELRDASKSYGMIQIYMAKARQLTPKTILNGTE